MKEPWNQLAKKMKKWSRIVRERYFDNPAIHVSGVSRAFHRKFRLIGNNWKQEPELPIAFMFGFNVWKRESVSQFLPEYRTAYVGIKSNFKLIEPFLSSVKNKVIVVWGFSEIAHLKTYAEKHNIPFYRMEDGFFRSIGLGVEHTPPLSLVLDKTGLYFDAAHPSDLENLLGNYSFQEDPQLLNRAEKCLSLVREFGITKYNFPGKKRDADQIYGPKLARRVLVVGQVEDDASIIHGCDKPITNQELLETAIRENPDAQIIYKPHPDVMLKGRLGALKKLKSHVNLFILDQHVTVPQALESIDHVYTITSLTGFEAIIRNIPVTVLGKPFYAGWGLTDDRCIISRRTRNLTPLELFAGTCLLYPRYKSSSHAIPSSLEIVLMEIIEQLHYPQLRSVSVPKKPNPEWMMKKMQTLLSEQNSIYSSLPLLAEMRSFSAAVSNPLVAQMFPLLLDNCEDVQERELVIRMVTQLLKQSNAYHVMQASLKKKEDLQLAIKVFQEYWADGPNEQVLTILIKLYTMSGQYELADRLSKTLEAKQIDWKQAASPAEPMNVTLISHWTSTLLKEYQYEQAERHLHRLLQNDYFSATWYEWMADVYAGRLDYESALFYMNFALAFSKPKERAKRIFRMGELSLKLEKLQDAHIYFWVAACLNPDFSFKVFGYTKQSNVYSPLDVDYAMFVQLMRNIGKPNSKDLLNLGRNYLNLADFPEAIRCLEKASHLSPDDVQIRIWLAHAYSYVQRYDEAKALFSQALPTGKNQILCVREYLRTLIDMDDYETAGHLLEYALKQGIDVGAEWEVKTYLGLHQIQKGFQAYRSMKLTSVMASCYPNQYFQSLEHLPAEATSLMIIALYGPGDELRWATLYSQLRSRFPSVQDIYVTCDPRLKSILERSFPDLHFIGIKRTGRNLPASDIPLYNQVKTEILATILDNEGSRMAENMSAITLMSDILGDLITSCDDFPMHQGYLKPDPVRCRYWRKRLDELGPGAKVGINWRSSLTTYNRNDYYTDILTWGDILSAHHSIFINLQYDNCQEELRLLREQQGHEVTVFPELDLYNDFESLAALVHELDLVIAPATNIVEMAGAVGRPVWLMSNVSTLHWRVHPETGLDLWHPQLKHIKGDKIRDKISLVTNLAENYRRWVAAQYDHENLSLTK